MYEFKDRVWQKTTKTGTGTAYALQASSTPTGYRAFSVLTDGVKTLVRIEMLGTAHWEVMVARWTASNSRLTRVTLLGSSNNGSPVNWPAGVKDVVIPAVAARQRIKVAGMLSTLDDDVDGSQQISLTVDELLAALRIEDGYGNNWVVTEDSLGTHLAPDRIVTVTDDGAAGAAVTIDLAASSGEWHQFALTEPNTTIEVTNFAHNDPAEPGKKFVLDIESAGGTMDWLNSPQNWVFPDGEPALTPNSGDRDRLEFLVTDIGGQDTVPDSLGGDSLGQDSLGQDSLGGAEQPTFVFIRPVHRPQLTTGSALPDQDADAAVTTISNGIDSVGTDLTVYWDLDEASGARAAAVGGINLAEAGGTVSSAAGIQNNAASFAGAGAYLMTAGESDTNSASNFTIAFWFKVTDNTRKQAILQKNTHNLVSTGSAASTGFGFFLSGASLRLQVNMNGAVVSSMSSIASNTWYHVALTASSTGYPTSERGKLYLNGVLESTFSWGGSPLADTTPLHVGYGHFATGNVVLDGAVDEVAISRTTALNAAQVQYLYESQDTYPLGGQNETQQITIVGTDAPTFGTFDLTLDGNTATLDFDEDAASAQTKLNAAFGAGSVTVSGGPLSATPLTVEFTGGGYALSDVDQMTVDNASMHNDSADVDWSREDLKTITLGAGSGVYVIHHVNIIPGKILTVAFVSNGASGTLSQDGGDATVEWGPSGAPTVPAAGETLYVTFQAVSSTKLIRLTSFTTV